jgi:SAM-dependent methyltransferase
VLRPYYHEFAWAYDLLQPDPVVRRVDFIQSLLSSHGIRANSCIVDAGCGTGRYAVELVKRGFRVWGVDRSADLIAVARNRETSTNLPTFVVADLLDASFPQPFDAVLCRGVLNDFVDDGDRASVFRRFASWLRPGGILIFDVREWTKTVVRYNNESIHRRTIELPEGAMRIESTTVLDRGSHELKIHERFDIKRSGAESSVENDFVMRCWTSDEVALHLSQAGLDEIARYPTYGESDQSWSDRMVVVARLRR